MKDVTSTSFGLLIAYLLPGLIGLYGLSFGSESLRQSLLLLLTAKANPELLILVILLALVCGLIIHGIRHLMFEVVFCGKEHKLGSQDFGELASERKLEAFRATVDEIYRYHQWWGGLSVAAPVVCFGWFLTESTGWTEWRCTFAAVGAIGFETLFIYTAKEVQKKYVARSRHILKEKQHERLGRHPAWESGAPAEDTRTSRHSIEAGSASGEER